MEPAPADRLWVVLAIAPVMAFGLYRVFKRTFGRQPLRPRSLVPRAVAFCVVTGLLLALVHTPEALAAAAGGLLAGLGLGVLGVRLTTIHATPAGLFFKANPWVGLTVMSLFVARMATRFVGVAFGADSPTTPPRSPLTLGLFALLAGYAVTLAAGLLWRRRVLATSTTPRPEPGR